ncbi:MAG: hypothetical protein L0027_17915 [Candidatus Rokubacteria bacterium]|nr:hypothetical protein [Candidatus Rokubacteria bacterium]
MFARSFSHLAATGLALSAALLVSVPADAADMSRVDRATKEVEQGAKKIGEGQIGPGVEQTAKGIGNTVVEGAKYTGEKFKEAGKAAEPEAKTAWQRTKDAATAFGGSVKRFFDSFGRE